MNLEYITHDDLLYLRDLGRGEDQYITRCGTKAAARLLCAKLNETLQHAMRTDRKQDPK